MISFCISVYCVPSPRVTFPTTLLLLALSIDQISLTGPIDRRHREKKECTAGKRLQDWLVTRTSLADSISSHHFHLYFLSLFFWPFLSRSFFSALNPYPVPITIPFVLNDLDRVVSILFVSKIQTSRASAWESLISSILFFLSLRTFFSFSPFPC